MICADELPVAFGPEVVEEELVLLPFFLSSPFLFNPQRFLRVFLRPADIDVPAGLFLCILSYLLSLFSKFQSTTANSPF